MVFWNVDPAQPARLGFDAGSWSAGVTLLSAVRLQEGDVTLAGERATVVVERRSGAGGALAGLWGFV